MRSIRISHRLAAVVVAASACGFAENAIADSDGFAPALDTTLYENATGNSNGAGDTLVAGRILPGGASAERRALIEFNVGGIPPGSVVTNVTLTLKLKQPSPGSSFTLGVRLNLHRLSSAWGEAGSNAGAFPGIGAQAQTGDATWVSRFHSQTAWSTSGGSFSSTASATLQFDAGPGETKTVTWGSTPEMVADVQAWVNNASDNHGWILLTPDATSGTAKWFHSRESSTSSFRPRLSVTWTTGAPDSDGDGVPDSSDNCPSTRNADQTDTDNDSMGDACDGDDDNDGVVDASDNCPLLANADQADNESDGVGDLCDSDDDNDGVVDTSDNCPIVANATQVDSDADTAGDACDADDDNDGMPDTYETANGLNPIVNDAAGDADGDGHTNLAEFLAGTNPQDPNSRPNSAAVKIIAPILLLLDD